MNPTGGLDVGYLRGAQRIFEGLIKILQHMHPPPLPLSPIPPKKGCADYEYRTLSEHRIEKLENNFFGGGGGW